MRLRITLPEQHLSDESRTLLQIGLGVIGTMAGLVLGLLVSSAASSYNAQRDELLAASSNVILLDRILAHYGPAAEPSRLALREVVQRTVDRLWPQNGTAPQLNPKAAGGETFFDLLEDLSPRNDRQRSVKADAMVLALNLGQVRWLMYAQSGVSVSWPLLILLIFWFTITFVGFGMLSPSNSTAITALALVALAVAGAILVILDMYSPFKGLVHLSSAPLRAALAQLTSSP